MAKKRLAKKVRSATVTLAPQVFERRIYLVRGQRVMLDSDLAEIYEVPTKRLNEQVRRNLGRLPKDFMFRLTREEAENLWSQFATSSWGGRRNLPLAFTDAWGGDAFRGSEQRSSHQHESLDYSSVH